MRCEANCAIYSCEIHIPDGSGVLAPRRWMISAGQVVLEVPFRVPTAVAGSLSRDGSGLVSVAAVVARSLCHDVAVVVSTLILLSRLLNRAFGSPKLVGVTAHAQQSATVATPRSSGSVLIRHALRVTRWVGRVMSGCVFAAVARTEGPVRTLVGVLLLRASSSIRAQVGGWSGLWSIPRRVSQISRRAAVMMAALGGCCAAVAPRFAGWTCPPHVRRLMARAERYDSLLMRRYP